jgi:RIO kinase 1
LGYDFEDVADRKEMEKVDWRRIRREKDGDVLKTVEEVFDNKTVMALYRLITKGIIEGMRGVVQAGKESRIYWAKGPSEEDLAVKIFLTSSMEFKRSMTQYIQGDPRFKIGHDYRRIVYTWAQKEFSNLKEARNVGVPVPTPIYAYENIIIMEFLGEDGVPSPILKEVPKDELTVELYDEIIGYVDKLFNKARLVHADLSEYNIMIHRGRPFFIDFGQAVLRVHPMADEFLDRDVGNIIRYFGKAGVNVPDKEEVLKWLKRT